MICLLFSTLLAVLKQMEEVVIIQMRDDYSLGPRVDAKESASSIWILAVF